ncbi:response regulator [bacterium]|nr:response regulator [candidate division CSSED10-310 bacterium]
MRGKSKLVRIDPEKLTSVVPFILVVDPELRIVWASDRMHAHFPGILHANASDLISYHPDCRQLSRDAINADEREVTEYLIQLSGIECKIKGKWIAVEDGFIMVAVADVCSPEDLQLYDLDDFSVIDQSIDLLSTRDEFRVSMEEAGVTLDQLHRTIEALEVSRKKLETENEKRRQAEAIMEQALAEAESASIAKSQFLAMMSHEIRTPLNGIIGMSNLFAETKLTSEQKEYLDIILISGEALLSVVNDILDFSKIEAGKLDLECVDFDLNVAVQESVDILAAKAEEKKLELVYYIEENVPTYVTGDPGRLRQIILNLGNNAIKFTHQGEILIRVSLDTETDSTAIIRFSISDTGIGIPHDRLESIFGAFTQVDASTTRRFGGTGLGLAISKKLSTMMGGEIGVTSEPGKGSKFWFSVALQKQTRPAPRQFEPRVSLTGRKILIVDDNETNIRVLSIYLNQWGVRSASATCGEEALAVMRKAYIGKDPFEIVIIDMMMPGMNGEELGSIILSDPDLGRTRLLILTSIGQRGDAARVKALGFSGYLTKPVKSVLLFNCLISVLNSKKSKDDRATVFYTRFSAEEEKAVRERSRSKKRILLAEDNVINQKVALRILEKAGFSAVVVANGREAVEAVRKSTFDAILMDCQMPVMDGYEASAQIRTMETGTGRIPIIAMTAHAMESDRKRCLESGMDDYISKPVTPDVLSAVLDRFLNEIPGMK